MLDRKIGIFCIILWTVLQSSAQERSLYPVVATLYTYENTFVNPAFIADTGKYHVDVVNKFRSSNRGNVGHLGMNGGLYLRNNDRAHSINLIFLSDKEGPYINRNKGYLHYATSVTFSTKTSLYAGIALGFSSTYINAVSASTVNNYIVPDANVGLGIRSGGLDFSVTMMQVLNNKVLPDISELQLTRYYHAQANYHFAMGREVELELAAFYRYFNDLDDHLNMSVKASYKDQIGIQLLQHTQRGFSFFGELTFASFKNHYNVTLGYNTGWGAELPLLHQSFEVGGSVVLF